jgi:hypothetical protein
MLISPAWLNELPPLAITTDPDTPESEDPDDTETLPLDTDAPAEPKSAAPLDMSAEALSPLTTDTDPPSDVYDTPPDSETAPPTAPAPAETSTFPPRTDPLPTERMTSPDSPVTDEPEET